MNNNIISVKLWGKEICKLEWRGGYKNRFGKLGAVVSFHPEYASTPWNLDPLGPYSTSYYFVREGLSDWCHAKENDGIPRFMSGSLPDEWGNAVFSAWMLQNNLHKADINAVDKLAFIGKRGMGALEFEPALYNNSAQDDIVLEQLYEAAELIQQYRENSTANLYQNPSVNEIMAVGMSAGGMHPKAIISINWETGQIRSGQIPLPEDFKHYIIKFKDSKTWPTAEVEYAYYMMAVKAGIVMAPCQMISIRGDNHFLSERFDRKGMAKIHMATLYALAGDVHDYQDIFTVCRKLNLPYLDIEQLFRRAVFNYLAGVCDDHDKNTSFLMLPDGSWHLSPAYDETFTVNYNNPLIADKHAMAFAGSNREISLKQFMSVAAMNDIRNANDIVKQVADSVLSFSTIAQELPIPEDVRKYIQDYIDSQCRCVI